MVTFKSIKVWQRDLILPVKEQKLLLVSVPPQSDTELQSIVMGRVDSDKTIKNAFA